MNGMTTTAEKSGSGASLHLNALQNARQIGTPQQKAKWLRNKRLIEQLRSDKIDVDTLIGKKEDYPKLEWREKLLEALHKPIGQLLLALLMLVDSAIIIGEIVLEVKMYIAEVHARELQIERLAEWMIAYVTPVKTHWQPRSTPRFEAKQTNDYVRFLDAVVTNASRVCFETIANASASVYKKGDVVEVEASAGVSGYRLEALAHAKEVEMEMYELAAEALAITSIIVLGLFVIEVLLKIVAMGPRKFLSKKLEVFDALIIFASFAVDLGTFFNKDPNPEATVMIILLIWRIVRLVNGFLMHEMQTAEAHNHIMRKVISLMCIEVQYLKRMKRLQTRQLQEFHQLCSRSGISEEEVLHIDAMPPVRFEDIFLDFHRHPEEDEHKHFPHNITVWFQQHSPYRHKQTAKDEVAEPDDDKEPEKVGFLLEMPSEATTTDT